MSKILPAAVVVHTDLRVVICAQHRSSYVKSNLQRHLRDAHLIHSTKNSNIPAYVDSLDIASKHDEVGRPNNGISPISGIPTQVFPSGMVRQLGMRRQYANPKLSTPDLWRPPHLFLFE